MLLKSNPDGVKAVDDQGCTALHLLLAKPDASLAACSRLIASSAPRGVMGLVNAEKRNPFQVALEVGVCGPTSPWSRADCRNILMQLAR